MRELFIQSISTHSNSIFFFFFLFTFLLTTDIQIWTWFDDSTEFETYLTSNAQIDVIKTVLQQSLV